MGDTRTTTGSSNGLQVVPGSVVLVVRWRQRGDRLSADERTATNPYTYELPFQTLQREHDMRVAYAEFEPLLKERAK